MLDKLEKVDPNFLNLNAKDKVLALLCASKTNNSKMFSQNIVIIVNNYLKITGWFNRLIISFSQ